MCRSLVNPEMMREFENNKCNWFPRTDTVEHAKYDESQRALGFCKVEWDGDLIVGLCGEAYCFGAGKDKFS